MVSDTIKEIMKQRNIKKWQLAKVLDISPQALTNKFSRDKWQVDELIKALDFLGCELVIESKPNTLYVLTNRD